MNLEQAQFEIEALQRRLAEYAGENQRLRSDRDKWQMSWEEDVYGARQERDKLREAVKVIAEALQSSQSELLFSPPRIIKDNEQQRQFVLNKSQVAIAMARELGLLEEK